MKKKVGIFMGGFSSEWEISMQSGQTVLDNLHPQEFDCYKVVINKKGWTVFQNDNSWPLNKGNLSFIKDDSEVKFDVIFNAIHGDPGENGYMQALFDLNKIPHSSCGFFESALTFNKNKTNELLASQAIRVPKSKMIRAVQEVKSSEICNEFGLPLFIKPNRSGSSFGVSRVTEENEIENAIKEALKEDNQVLIEEAIIGTEVGCGVVKRDGKTEAIAVTEIVPKKAFFDYEAKYKGASDEITPARIKQDIYDLICRISEQIYDYLDLWGVIRIDYIIQNNIPVLIEVNSVPGLSPASIVPQQLAHRNWALAEFFGGLLLESIERYQHK